MLVNTLKKKLLSFYEIPLFFKCLKKKIIKLKWFLKYNRISNRENVY